MNDVHDESRRFSMVPHDVIRSVKDGNAIALYTILKMYADNKTGLSHPSRKKLAELMGYSTVKMVDKALEILKSWKLVATFPRYRDTDGHISRKRTDEFNVRTSNGYVLYDTPVPIGEGVMPYRERGSSPIGDGGLCPIGDRNYTQFELDPTELDLPRTPPGNGPSQSDGLPTLSKLPAQNGRRDYPDRFETFWRVYPRKEDKPKAYTAWRNATRRGVADELMITAASDYAKQCQVRNTPKDKIKYAEGWLNGDRFNNTYDTTPPAQDRSKFDQIMQAGMSLSGQHHDQKEITF